MIPATRAVGPVIALLLIAAAAFPARGAEEPAPPPPAEIPRRPDPVPATLDRFLARPDELPEGIRLDAGMPTVASNPRAFHEKDAIRDLLPPEQAAQFPEAFWKSIPPRRGKALQAFAAKGGVPGTVFVYEYAEDPGPNLRSFLRGYLWGEEGRPTEAHPEEFQIHGRFVVILSFPRGDPGAEWFKERLRRTLRLPAVRSRTEFDDLAPAVLEALSEGKAEEGLGLLGEDPDRVADWAFGWHLRARLELLRREWREAEGAALRALELDAALEDPMPDGLAWTTLEMVGTARFQRGDAGPAADAFRRAAAFARRHGIDPEEASRSSYNLARALAKREEWEESLAALRDAVAARPAWKGIARRDEVLAAARERPEFRELLGK